MYDRARAHAASTSSSTLPSRAGLLYWWHVLSPIRSACGSRARRRSATWPHQAAGRAARHRAGVRARRAVLLLRHKPHYWGLTPHEDQALAGVDDGARAVDRDGHRARLPVRARCSRSPSARSSGASATSEAPCRAAGAAGSRGAAGDRADQDRVGRELGARADDRVAPARRRRRSCAPSPITIGPIEPHARADPQSRPIHTGRRLRRPPATGAVPDAHALGASSSPISTAARRAARRTCPAGSSPSEPTSFQYSEISWMWKGMSLLEQRREHVLRPVDERPVGEVVEDRGLEHVDAAVAQVRQRLSRGGLLLEARDAAVARRAARRRTRACRRPA